jgi:dephospho-CoA kinase
MGRRLRIGLTGGIASGKSTVAARFMELGVPVVDADAVSRQVVEPGSPGLGAIVARFGRGILSPAGTLERRALRDLIFADPAARHDLERITHPLIWAEMERQAQAVRGPYLVMEIPLLAESGRRDRVDRVLVVDTAEASQMARLMARDGGSEAQARAMLAAQADRAQRLAVADDVLENTGGLPELRRRVDRLHERYLELCGVTPR